jgi:hypothetical protein
MIHDVSNLVLAGKETYVPDLELYPISTDILCFEEYLVCTTISHPKSNCEKKTRLLRTVSALKEEMPSKNYSINYN